VSLESRGSSGTADWYARERHPGNVRGRSACRKGLLDERALVRTLKVLRELIEEEHALEVDRAAATPPWAFAAVAESGTGSGRRYQFRRPGWDDVGERGPRLRAGDAVDLVAPDASAALASGSVIEVMAHGVTVDFGRPVDREHLPARGFLRSRVDDNQRTIRVRALERLARDRHALPWLGPALAGAAVAPPAEDGWCPSPEDGLTPAQARAVAAATRSGDVFLIQGPPGTGKTTVIAALVRYFTCQRGARVLLTAKGHRAIDNALDRLDAADLHVVRLGQAAKVTGAGQDLLLSEAMDRAQQAVPERHQAAKQSLQEAARALAAAEDLLAQVASVDSALAEAESAMERRLAEIDTAVAARLALFAQRSQPPGRREQDWVDQTRRFYLARDDLVVMREHVGRLREDRYRLALSVEAVLPRLRPLVSGHALPHLSVARADEVRGSLAAVSLARRRAEVALAATRGWGTAIERPGGVPDMLIDTADVVAATAVGVSSGRDGTRTASLEYDVAIIDEAGQAGATDLVVPLSRARTAILVGDHKQLAPFVDEDLLRRCREKRLDTVWLEKSLFELLWTRLPESHRVRLNLQFRMPEEVASFLGRAFYEGDYATVESRRGGTPVSPLFRSPLVVVDTSAARDRGEIALTPGYANGYEARLIGAIVARLPAELREPGGLGVIAPYGGQVAAVRRELADRLGLASADPWLLDNVATVDSFQGQERNVIVVSLTRSNPQGSVGFLSDLNRLNVTLSRARRQLVLIADLATVTAHGGGPERRAFAQFARDLARHARQQGELLLAGELAERLTGG